jgi:Uma2 family endonuclease
MPSVTAVSVSEYLGTEYDPNCEYIDGVLVPKPMPTWRHSRVQGRIFTLIDSRFPEFVIGTEPTVQIREKKYLVPDLAVQDASRLQEPYPIAPIVLCIEVLSPEDSLKNTFAKCEEYHAWGTVNTWIVDPVACRAWQYTKGSQPEEIDRSGELHAGPIHVPVADIFQGLDTGPGR